MHLKQGVAAYRSAYLVEQGMRRLQGRSLSLTPLYWQCEHRIVGLIFLLRIALRVLGLMQFVARENVQKEGTTRKGISPGQPGRQTTRPTTEMLLPVFRGITLSRMTVNGETYEHLTPLTPVQERIVALIGLPLETSSRLAPQLSKTDFHSHEP
jgi:transposase